MSPTHPSSGVGGPSASRHALRIIVLVLIVLAVAAALVANAVTTAPIPTSSFPITVDGTTTPTTTSPTTSVTYKTGSLYSAQWIKDGNNNDISDGTNLTQFIVGPVAGQKGLCLIGSVESSLISESAVYASGSPVADVALTLNINGAPRGAVLKVRGAGKGSKTPFAYSVALAGSNSESNPGPLGIQLAANFTSNTALKADGSKFLLIQFAIPLANAKATFPVDTDVRVRSAFYTPAGQALQISDGVVHVKADLSTDNTSIYVPGQANLVIGNIGSLDPTKNGTVQVTIARVAGDITDAQVQTALAAGLISIRDFNRDAAAESALDFATADVNGKLVAGGSFFTTGAHPFKYNLRTNSDGTQDLVLFFAVPDLVSSTNIFRWSADTSQVELAAIIGQSILASKANITVSSL